MTVHELREQMMVVPYPELEPHVRRGAVILVDASLDLAETALLMAENQHLKVKTLLDQGLLTKASPADLDLWRQEKAFFEFIVIQPFVVGKRFLNLKKES
jgi:hypothetical protein